MSVVLHISDPHFGTEQPPVTNALLQLYAQQKPDLVVTSGDITQRARRSQFRAAEKFFAQIAAPTLIIPGNHDIPLFNIVLRIVAPYANYQCVFGKNLQSEFLSDELFVIGLNTTRPRRHIDGEISAEQIRYVCERVAVARPEQLKIVVTHQPVHVITPADTTNLLHGYLEAIEAWSQAGVDIILGGHIHLPYVRSLHDYHDQIGSPLWAVQAGTALSRRVRGGVPNSVNILRYAYSAGGRRCCVEQWDFAARSETFELAATTPIALSLFLDPNS